MKILHVMGDCNPAKGGVTEGVLRLGDALRSMGHEQHLLTLDGPSDPWAIDCPSPVFAMGQSSAAKRFYPRQAIGWLRANAGRYDGIVVDGLWNASTVAAARVLPSAGVPYVVFPHGMLDPWFRRLQPVKEWIKRGLFRVQEGPLLRGARAVLFTSEHERAGAAASWPGWRGITEAVVGFGTGEPPPRRAAMVPALADRPYLLFLSRIHPKKGCEILLEALATLGDAEPIELVMAGPGDPAYVARLQSLADRLGVAHRVQWSGMLAGDAKWGAIHGCEALVLPSYQENFGVVVAEAMACARPVLVSEGVDLHPLVSAIGAGLVCKPEALSLATAIQTMMSSGVVARAKMGAAGRDTFTRELTMERLATRILPYFEETQNE